MLSEEFYTIQSATADTSDPAQGSYHFIVDLREHHPIYQGHFPGSPVVPGVCQVQMVKELVENAVNHRTNLTESDNIKFLAMINPRLNPQLEFDILIKFVDKQHLAVVASIRSVSVVFLKFKGKFESFE